jgi:hypothetical protein
MEERRHIKKSVSTEKQIYKHSPGDELANGAQGRKLQKSQFWRLQHPALRKYMQRGSAMIY